MTFSTQQKQPLGFPRQTEGLGKVQYQGLQGGCAQESDRCSSSWRFFIKHQRPDTESRARVGMKCPEKANSKSKILDQEA